MEYSSEHSVVSHREPRLIRAIGVLWLASIGLRLGKSPPIGTHRRAQRVGAGKTGFTLVETLVVVSLIALLIGLLLPAIEGTFFAARQTRQAIRQRETYSAVMAYVEDYKNTFPYFGTPGDPYGLVTIDGVPFKDNLNYFTPPRFFWASVLVPEYIPDRSMLEAPGIHENLLEQGIPETLVLSLAELTTTVYAAPKYFHDRDEGEPLDYTQFRATRRYEMVFPADKGLLVTFGDVIPRVGDEIPNSTITFGDGSTTQLSQQEVNALPAATVPFGGGVQIHTTYRGLAGRDRPGPSP